MGLYTVSRALNQAKWPGLKDVRSQCIDLLRTSTTDIRETNGSLLSHRLDNGGVGNSPEQAIKGRSWQLAEYVYVTNFMLAGIDPAFPQNPRIEGWCQPLESGEDEPFQLVIG